MTEAQMVLTVLTLIAAVVAPLVAVMRLRATQRAETERLLAKMEESLGASVKLLEVRNYYEQMSGELKKMLDEAYKEGNRFRQDHLRRLIERLEQMKARTLDRTTRLLETEDASRQNGGRRHRRHRGGRRGGQGQNFQGRPQGQGQGQGPGQGQQQGRPQNPQPGQGRPQNQQPQQQRPQQNQPPRQEPPKPQQPRQEPPRNDNPPAADPRQGPAPSPFEE